MMDEISVDLCFILMDLELHICGDQLAYDGDVPIELPFFSLTVRKSMERLAQRS